MNDVAWALQTARQVGPVHPPHAHAHPIHKAHLTHTGPLRSHVAGRTDHLPSQVPNGSFVLPADIVSGLGEGNTEAGFKIAKRMFEGARRHFGGLPYAGENGPYGQGGGGPYLVGRASGGIVVRSRAEGGPLDKPPTAPQPIEGIMAYHGSPHQFDKFDASKIGTGEGAQAYGHGLYFAQDEGVARNYRDKLSGPGMDAYVNGNKTGNVSSGLGHIVNDPGYVALVNEAIKSDAPQWIKGAVFQAHRNAAENGKTLTPDELTAHAMKRALGDLNPSPENRAKLEAHVRSAVSGLQGYELRRPGHMYHVRIKAHPEHFLDWDKPLSEQSEHVRKAFHHTEAPTYPDTPGQHLMGFLSPNAAAASKEMQKRGIRGIRYLDQGSLGHGEGTHNYVVFDPKDIEIVRRYAQGGDVEADQQAVPVAVAGGEHVLAPHEVAFAGLGDTEAGHKALEAFVLRQRAKLIKTLKGLPGPKND